MTGDGVTEIFRVLDLSGVFANALLGGLIARQEKLDPIGFATLAVLSGLGGGVLRDVLLQQGPPAALTDYAYLLAAFAGAAVSYIANLEGVTWARVWPVVDAVALGCWASTGAAKTLAVGLGWLPAVLLGVITAVGGGAVRDVVLRRVPGVLGGKHAVCDGGARGLRRPGPVGRARPRHRWFCRWAAGRRGFVSGRPLAWVDPPQRRRMVTQPRRTCAVSQADQATCRTFAWAGFCGSCEKA